MGSGDCFDDLVAQRDRLHLGDHVELTGRVPDETVAAVLSTADVGLSPDPKNPLNDVSTMNKTMEYMAFGLPVVAFDLRETRVSAGDAAVYAEPNRVDRFAEAVVELVDDPQRREQMGRLGRRRVERELAWHHQSRGYLAVFDELSGRRATGRGVVPRVRPAPAVDELPAVAER
jgi:glycosyltransferase involved in cell wall biosynthesis